MRKIVSFIGFLIIISSLYGQQSQKGLPTGEATTSEKFRLAYKFGVNVFHNFVFNEETEIVRTDLNAKKVKTFTRKAQIFFTMVQNSLPDKGFNTIKVSIDSLRYELQTDDGTKYSFNSQDDEFDWPFSTNEFKTYYVLLGKEFYMTYSPYNEVVKIEGEMLDSIRIRINHPEDGIKDPELKFVWDRLLLPSFLKNIPDIAKNLIPEHTVTKSDVWKRYFEIWVDGANFADTAEVKLIEFSPKEYVIEANLKNLKGKNSKNNVYGIDELVDIHNLNGKGQMIITVLPRGVVKEGTFKGETEYEFEYDQVKYRQKSLTTYTWQLEKMYR